MKRTFFFFSCKKQKCKVGGLDLSRRDLDRDLDLDAKKKSVSTSFKNWSRRDGRSRQFKNQVSTVSTTLKIEISRFLSRSWSRSRSPRQKKSVSTVEKISTSFKNWSRRDGRSWSRSRLVSTSRPPSLQKCQKKWWLVSKSLSRQQTTSVGCCRNKKYYFQKKKSKLFG